MSSLLFYIFLFMVSACFLNLLQKLYSRGLLIGVRDGVWLKNDKRIYFFLSLICVTPIILIYGLRYGIGTDYFSYLRIYNVIHDASLRDYFMRHRIDKGAYYVEFGYYLLNRVCSSFRGSLFVEGVLIYAVLFWILREYSGKLNAALAVYIYLCTQFTFSMNVIRFAIGLMFVLCGYKCLVNDNPCKFIICIMIGGLFHKTLLVCLLFYVLKEFKDPKINKLRNVFVIACIVFFSFISRYLLRYFKTIFLFKRYFETSRYDAREIMSGSFSWTVHIIPVIMPLLIFCYKEMKRSAQGRNMFRLYLMEIPLRMLGLYNTWYTRMARCGQIVVVLLIPYILYQIENKKKRQLLTLYYLVWYTFYFCYYAVVGDGGDTLPYVSVFGNAI